MLQFPYFPSNKSEEFPQILQPWWLSLKNFQGISQESFLVTDSSKILEKFSRIGPQDERFLWDHSFETQFWEFLWNTSPKILEKFLELGHHAYGFLEELLRELVSRKSSEFLLITSPEIPEKLLVLGHQVYGFLGEFIERISFKKFLGISPEFQWKKILRISPVYFSRNSWEILILGHQVYGF